MSRFLDTYLASDASNSEVRLTCLCVAGCCVCGIDNVENACSNGLSPSFALKAFGMMAGTAAGIYCAYLLTPLTFNAVADSMRANSDAAEWSIEMLAGITNTAVDALAPIAGFNIGGWSARAASYGLSKLKTSLFNSKSTPTAPDVTTEHPSSIAIETNYMKLQHS